MHFFIELQMGVMDMQKSIELQRSNMDERGTAGLWAHACGCARSAGSQVRL